jgi:hypothetical protein
MPSHAYETQFLIALLITLAVETSLLLLVVRLMFRLPAAQLGSGVILFAGILASSATLPYVWFVVPAFIGSYRPFVVVSEGLVLVAETVMLMFILRLRIGRALAAAAICNVTSFAIGEIVKSAGP